MKFIAILSTLFLSIQVFSKKPATCEDLVFLIVFTRIHAIAHVPRCNDILDDKDIFSDNIKNLLKKCNLKKIRKTDFQKDLDISPSIVEMLKLNDKSSIDKVIEAFVREHNMLMRLKHLQKESGHNKTNEIEIKYSLGEMDEVNKKRSLVNKVIESNTRKNNKKNEYKYKRCDEIEVNYLLENNTKLIKKYLNKLVSANSKKKKLNTKEICFNYLKEEKKLKTILQHKLKGCDINSNFK